MNLALQIQTACSVCIPRGRRAVRACVGAHKPPCARQTDRQSSQRILACTAKAAAASGSVAQRNLSAIQAVGQPGQVRVIRQARNCGDSDGCKRWHTRPTASAPPPPARTSMRHWQRQMLHVGATRSAAMDTFASRSEMEATRGSGTSWSVSTEPGVAASPGRASRRTQPSGNLAPINFKTSEDAKKRSFGVC